MEYRLKLNQIIEKNIYDLGEEFRGSNGAGEELSFTNYYMQKNNVPFYGVSGEFHYSRMSDSRWEDEIIKMKMAGLNTIATYVFWIHHEEEEGVFDFSGCRNLRKFIQLCKKHEMYVILRVGPFDHGEVRNGGIPDWMYGKPFEVRKISEGFLFYTRRLYSEIAKQVQGLFYKDQGPIIGIQIDNEYMHSSAPWEITTGISDEWVFGGDEGEEYMLTMKDLAAECGLLPVFYTCTGWGGAITPKSMLPLWGGYAFRPWLFYSYKGEHPATEEYIYQDFHKNGYECNYDFHPRYQPEEKPYACCEMGGGMGVSYYYRFQYPYKSVDAMANIKIASGCNFLGYYMFQGGSNPVGKHGTFMNEGQVPKISYDYQAALGEYGQVRESYRRTKTIHQFVSCFKERLCGLQTVLPEGASFIEPTDKDTLRYAVRTDGRKGFVFVNNYQDHAPMSDKHEEKIILELKNEMITLSISIAEDENAILPFHFDMEGADLIWASAQPVTIVNGEGTNTWVFMIPDGMDGTFVFAEDVKVNGKNESTYTAELINGVDRFRVEYGQTSFDVLVLNRVLSNQMYQLKNGTLVFTGEALLEDMNGIRLETMHAQNTVYTYPAQGVLASDPKDVDILGVYSYMTEEKAIDVSYKKVADNRYTVHIPSDCMDGLKDALLQIDYQGDIGHAFIDGSMISDNFCNGATWEIGLKDFAERLKTQNLTVYITPLKEGVNVNVESSMAARKEEVMTSIGVISNVAVCPVYEINL
ncbi:MAG: beta-galactosidase [Oliverpabstia sp.]